jgi:two-component system alkaline phosphatase synthesis response regulator PhoP
LKILVVDDEPGMVGVIAGLLGQAGHRVVPAYDGDQALLRLDGEDPDLILLDLSMPGLDGAEVCRRIRRRATMTPIIIVTGEQDGLVSAELLDAGADDYVRKPFRGEELLARVHAVSRRRAAVAQHAGWAVDRGNHELRWHGRTIGVTPIEYRLMLILVEQRGNVVRTQDLLASVWPGQGPWDRNWLKPHLSRLRRKLDAVGAPEIRAARSIGYRLAAGSAAAADRDPTVARPDREP